MHTDAVTISCRIKVSPHSTKTHDSLFSVDTVGETQSLCARGRRVAARRLCVRSAVPDDVMALQSWARPVQYFSRVKLAMKAGAQVLPPSSEYDSSK
jgi:hypothetical protein